MLEHKQLIFWLVIIFCFLGWFITVIDSLIHEPFTWQVFNGLLMTLLCCMFPPYGMFITVFCLIEVIKKIIKKKNK